MQEKLIAWIEGNQEYARGLELYQEHGSSALLKKVLAQGPTDYNRSKLLAEIQKIYASLPPKESITTAQILSDELPDEEVEKALIQERNNTVKEAGHLKAQLPLIQSLEKRRAIAYKILELYDRNAEIWATLDYKQAHGFFPKKSGAPVTQETHQNADKAELQRRLLIIRPKLSRIKGKQGREKDYEALLQEKFELERLIAIADAI